MNPLLSDLTFLGRARIRQILDEEPWQRQSETCLQRQNNESATLPRRSSLARLSLALKASMNARRNSFFFALGHEIVSKIIVWITRVQKRIL